MYTPTGYMQIKHTAAYTDIMRYIQKYCSQNHFNLVQIIICIVLLETNAHALTACHSICALLTFSTPQIC